MDLLKEKIGYYKEYIRGLIIFILSLFLFNKLHLKIEDLIKELK